MSKVLIIVCGVFAVLFGAALIAVKVLMGNVADLSAEKAKIQAELNTKTMDLTASAKNSERMLAEKDAELASERRMNEATLQIKTLEAGTHKDIAHAADSTKCTESDPFAAALDGMRQLERFGPPVPPDDRVPPASRVGKAAKPGAAAGAGKGGRRPGPR